MYWWAFAGAAALKYLSAQKRTGLKKQDLYDSAGQDELYADQIMRTHKKNAQQKRENLYRFTTQRADQAGQERKKMLMASDRASGKLTTAIAASGAKLGEGTTLDLEVQQAVNGWITQKEAGVRGLSDIEMASTQFNQWADADFESSRMHYDRLITSAKLKRKQGHRIQKQGDISNLMDIGAMFLESDIEYSSDYDSTG